MTFQGMIVHVCVSPSDHQFPNVKADVADIGGRNILCSVNGKETRKDKPPLGIELHRLIGVSDDEKKINRLTDASADWGILVHRL